MKPIYKFLMALILLVSITGFGNTTTDPEQNSTAVVMQDHNDKQVVITNQVEENRFVDLFKKADRKFSETYRDKINSFKSEALENYESIKISEADFILSSRNYKLENYNYDNVKYRPHTFRNPRDGIRVFFS